MKIRHIILLVSALAFSGCFLFDGGAITDVSIDGVDQAKITATIDPNARTVVVSVPAIDLAYAVPQFTVTDGASVDFADAFADGVPQSVAVTSGLNTQTWTVTINLRPGVSFQVDGSWVFLEHGVTDSSDSVNAAALGDDVPLCSYYDTDGYYLDLYASSETIDVSAPPATPVPDLAFGFVLPEAPPAAVGTYSWNPEVPEVYAERYGEIDLYNVTDAEIVLKKASTSPGEISSGTFYIVDNGVAYDHGYFKLVQADMNAHDQYSSPGGEIIVTE